MDITDRVLADLAIENQSEQTTADLMCYLDDLDYLDINFQWAHAEIQNHLDGWIKAGIVAGHVKLKSLWKDSPQKFKNFADYCQRGLGRSNWYIDRIIDAAKVVVDLARFGFKVLPNCEAQARPLVKAFKDGTNNVFDLWESVLSQHLPANITASKIESIVNGETEEKPKQGISKETIELAKKLAKLEGRNVDELIQELIRDRLESSEDEGAIVESIEFTAEDVEQIEALDRTWKKAPGVKNKVSIVDNLNLSIDKFDNFMSDLIGQFIPPPRLKIT